MKRNIKKKRTTKEVQEPSSFEEWMDRGVELEEKGMSSISADLAND